MPDVKTPNEDKQIRLSEDFNDEFTRHLMKLGWTDPEMQKRFVALINSYMLSGGNASAQRVIVNYLDKGLDILNIELKRIEISNDNKVVQVNPDDVDNQQEQQPQVEYVTQREFNQILSEGRSKRLSKINVFKQQISDNKKRNQIVRRLLNDKDADPDEVEEKLTEAINFMLERNILKEQGSVNANNFRVFFKNYLNDDKGWSADSTTFIIDGILEAVENASGNINAQNKLVRETDLLIKRLQKIVEIRSAEQTKNSKIAFNELATLSNKLRGWSSEFFSEFIDNVLKIVGSAKNSKVQRYVANQVKDLHTKLPKDKKEQPKKQKEEPKNNSEDTDGEQGQSGGKGKGQ